MSKSYLLGGHCAVHHINFVSDGCPKCAKCSLCGKVTSDGCFNEYCPAEELNTEQPVPELATLRAEVAELKRLQRQSDEMVTALHREAKEWRTKAEEAERKLKRICKCEFSSGGVLKKSCEYHNQREEVAKRNALERAAKVCDEQALEPECPERAKYCADAIRALMKEGGE